MKSKDVCNCRKEKKEKTKKAIGGEGRKKGVRERGMTYKLKYNQNNRIGQQSK